MTWFRFNGFFSAPVTRNTPARRGDTISGSSQAQEPFSPIWFDGPLLIVGGGTVPPGVLHELAGHCVGLVGADSGGDAIVAAGLVPDAVIGDFDSIANPAAFPPPTRVIEILEQQTTDFEKCLYCTCAPLTLALGITGGRFDHTLAALHAIATHAHTRRIILIDESDLALGVSGSLRVNVGTDRRVSIYPLGHTRFASSSGLVYPLDGLEMEQGKSIGTSNRSNAETITIEVAPGEQSPWLLILERDLLPALL